ncbi:MAG: amino acid ABC transporter substrate-binding protein [Gammaproteobacteria bacterium]|nr:amino acid ABC transporter substrate-binding protein [Candidatus Neomarinimicrobiota bacterium]MBT7308436.1 amino acid ABC transporter substrate-binding protein [Gammaproteobacteria bacterium]
MRMNKIIAGLGVTTLIVAGTVSADTLTDVKEKGYLQCGVGQGLPGFSSPDESGHWQGIDVDVCRAVAAATLGDANKVKYTPLSAKERFTALQSGEIDILSRNTTETFTRDTALGLDFAGINYYDGQGFMVRKGLGISSAKELSGAAVCTNAGTTTEMNAADYFRSNGMDYKIVAFEKMDEVVVAYDAGRCDVFTTDRSGLAAQRSKLKEPAKHMILPETISKEPLGPVVRHGDNRWGDVVRWSLRVMKNAEEMGVTSSNVDAMRADKSNPARNRLLGTAGNMGEKLGLSNEWSYNIIKQVGNYGEAYSRNLGPTTPINLPRGINNLWTNGGIQYAAPIR